MTARHFGLVTLVLLISGCARINPADEDSPQVLGVVAEVAEDRQSVVISHEKIPGFMDAMVMGFDVADPSVLDGVEPDDEVRFRLALKPEPHITEIKRIADEEGLPPFKLTAIDGSELDSAKLRGKIVLVNFWATWCAPCRTETPWFVELKEQFQDRGFEVVGIAVDAENRKEIAEFVEEFKINYPIVYSDGQIEGKSGVFGLPSSFLIDRQGRIIKKHIGIVSKEVLAEEIERLL